MIKRAKKILRNATILSFTGLAVSVITLTIISVCKDIYEYCNLL